MEMAENNSESLSVFIWSDDGATGGLRPIGPEPVATSAPRKLNGREISLISSEIKNKTKSNGSDGSCERNLVEILLKCNSVEKYNETELTAE